MMIPQKMEEDCDSMNNSKENIANSLEVLLQELIELLNSSGQELRSEKIILSSIQVLAEDVLVKAKFYEGDLLMTVLAIKKECWKNHPTAWKEIVDILESQSDKIKNQQVSFEMKVDWYEKIEGFKKIGIQKQ